MAIFCILGYLLGGGITGYVIYQQTELTKQWDFTNSADYNYNNSLININNEVSLVSETEIITIEDYDYDNYYITSALYNPSDKTDKVNVLDNKKFEANKNKIFDIIFEEKLDNSDIIHLYMKSGNADEIFLCDLGNECESPGYGKIDYDGNEGWYNITISGLSEGTTGFNINQDGGKAKFNYVYATQNDEEISIAKALYNPNDKTDKVSALDNSKLEVNKNKLFNIIFDNKLNNSDTLALYMKSGTASEIYICAYGTICSSPGYGKVDYDGNEGWYNITISGLSESTKYINIDPDKAKFDYIYSYRIINNSYTIENTTYPNSATIDTQDFTVEDFYSWDILIVDESLNNQDINYYYSTNSGEDWNLISDFNLSSVNSSTIRLRAELISNRTNTPTLNSMTLNYLTSVACEEDWGCAEWSPEECPENETQTRTCTDSNECGSEDNKPETTRSCEYCAENWVMNYGDCIINNTKLKYYTDENNCGTTNSIPEDNSTYVECDYCTPNWTGVNTSCQMDNTIIAWYNDTNNCFAQTSLESDNNPPANNTYSCDYCTPSWQCSNYASCSSDNIQVCNTIIDSNNCQDLTNSASDQYSGDYSEFAMVCNYDTAPPEISNILVTPTKGVVGINVSISLNIDDESNISFAQAIISDSNNVIKKLSLYNNNLYTTTWNTTNTTKGTYLIGINVSDTNNNNAYYKQIATIALDGSVQGSFINSSVPLIKDQTTVINATETTDMVIEITSGGNLNASISTAQYSENLRNKTPPKTALVKYLDIIVDNTTNKNITKAKIVVYYNDSEINNANIDENTLGIHYYNETKEDWQILNSSVNTTANYVWAELPHFSTYGVFGEQQTAPQQSSGGGRYEDNNRDHLINQDLISEIAEEENQDKKVTIKESNRNTEEDICVYNLELELPEKISFVDADRVKGNIINNGECDLDRIELSINWETIPILSIEDENIGSIKIGEKKEIYLKKNRLVSNNPLIVGFTVKLMEEELKNYNMELIANGIAKKTRVVQKNLPLNIEVLEPSEEMTLKPWVILSMIIALSLVITLKKIFKKRK